MNVQELYQKKLTTAAEAVKAVKSGDWVDYGWCTNHPYTLDKALAARQSELRDVKVRGGVTMWMPEICKAEDAGEHFTWHSWHCSGIDRKIIAKGMGYFSPMRYSELPRFYRDGNATVDVAMIQVTPMDKHGNFSYALACSHLADMLDAAKTVIVEVNENLPWVYGLTGCEINIKDVDMVVEGENPPVAQLGAGGAPRASIELGRGNFKKAERILGTSAAFLVAIALTLTVILQATKEPVLRAFGASDANIGYAVDFITIYLVGTVFVQLTLGLNNFISAQGKTTIAMTSVLIGTGTSIILDPVFIFVLGWGVKGAAVANVIAQLISSVWIILFLASGRSAIRLRPSNIRFNRVIVPILTLGLAPFIMQITECLINVVFNVGLQRYGGDDYVTSMTIITSLMQVVSVLTNGFQQGIQPIIGFNFGARRMDRVRQAIRVAFIAQITSATVLVSILAAFPSVFAAWFTSSPEVIGIVTRMMPVFVAGWGVFGIQMGAQCALVGMGQAKQSVFLAIFRKIIMLVPLALTLPHWIGVTGIFLAEPISDATSGIVAGILFYVTYRSLTRADDAKNR